MHMTKPIPRLNAQILEEATSWFVDFNDEQVDQAGREEFNAWLRRSPEHVRAFLQISAFWEDAGTLGKRPDLDLERLIASARTEYNVVPLAVAASERTPDAVPTSNEARPEETTQAAARGHSRAKRLRLAIAASILLCLAVGTTGWYHLYGVPTYATAIGEQRSIVLEDGSSVELNSHSRVQVRFTSHQRFVDLIEGQAMFTVAKNPARPFIVATGDTQVRAVGTRFDVYRKRTGTVVTVVEGRVAVAHQQAPNASAGETPALNVEHEGPGVGPGETLLAAGEQLRVTPLAIELPRPANIAAATAWTDQRLVFESTSLREVVEEFNRYNRQQLVIRDPELNDFHISGVFPSTDSGPIVEFLRQRFGVTLNSSREQIEISRREHGVETKKP
jgi:transmembrane sensor